MLLLRRECYLPLYSFLRLFDAIIAGFPAATEQGSGSEPRLNASGHSIDMQSVFKMAASCKPTLCFKLALRSYHWIQAAPGLSVE